MTSSFLFFLVYLTESLRPIFKTELKFHAIKGQDNFHRIVAESPDDTESTYSFGNQPDGMNITKEGFLSFKPKEIGIAKVVIKATDICGAFKEKEFVFESQKCSCEGENGGFCEWKDKTRNGMRCVCPDGCVKDGYVKYTLFNQFSLQHHL